jgi:hypothetical protein
MRPIIPGTELTPIVSLPALYNPRDLALIRRTVASDTTDDEFALFIHWARGLRLDPLRRQVHAFAFTRPTRKSAASPSSPTKPSPPSSATTPSKPRPIPPALSVARSGSGNTPTDNGSRSRAWRAGRNSRRSSPSGSTTSRPTARSSTSPAAGETCLSSCSPNARRRKPPKRPWIVVKGCPDFAAMSP